MGNRSRRSWRERLAGAGLAGVLVIGGWVVLDVRGWIESATFYLPTRERVVTPPGVEDVTIKTPGGPTLHAWYVPPAGPAARDGPAPAILHVHGNAGTLADHAASSAFLADHGFGVLVFDYRGYGMSSRGRGPLTRDALLEDSHAALDALLARPGVDRDRIGVLGFSLGGVLGMALASERAEVRCVAAIAPFSSWKGVASDHAGPLGRLLIRPGLDAVESVRGLGDRPLLLVHGTADRVVPSRHASLIESAASEAGVPAEVVLLPGADHNDPMPSDAEGRIATFYARSLRAGDERPR